MAEPRPTPAMIGQAAHWAAQLATDEATQDDRDACEAWCREHPLHRLAMDRMRGFDARFGRTDDIDRAVLDTVIEHRARRGGGMGRLAFGVILLAAGGWMAAQSLTVRGWFPDYRTVPGEQRTVTLADGSTLTIDTDTEVDVRRSDSARTVTLFHGQVLARVAKDKARSFIVETADGTATAHGTAFIVNRDADATTVTVTESSVRVCLARQTPKRCADLAPGDRVRMAKGRLQHLDRVDPEAAASWAEGWLAADDQPVVTVLDTLNRYRHRPVLFDRGALAHMRVSGSFPLTDTDRALEGITQSAGLRLSRRGDGMVWVMPAK